MVLLLLLMIMILIVIVISLIVVAVFGVVATIGSTGSLEALLIRVAVKAGLILLTLALVSLDGLVHDVVKVLCQLLNLCLGYLQILNAFHEDIISPFD